MISDYLLMSSLSMRPNTANPERRTAIQRQLASLHAKYQMANAARREFVVTPDGVVIVAHSDVMAFASDSVWFDPIAILYQTRGTLPVLAFKGHYGVTLTGGQYAADVPDGAMARREGSVFIFRAGRWNLQTDDPRLAASSWELGFPPRGCYWECQRDAGCPDGPGQYSNRTQVVSGSPKKADDGWVRVCK
jgi:hypothetical protein